MKSLKEMKREMAGEYFKSLAAATGNPRARLVSEMSDDCDGWRRMRKAEDVLIEKVYGSADGVVKIKDFADESGEFWGEVIIPIHNQVAKGDIFTYTFDDLYLGNSDKVQDWDLDGLRDHIIGGVKHKAVDDVVTNPTIEQKLYEEALSDDEVNDLIAKAREGAVEIRKSKKHSEEDKEEAKEVVKWIDGVKRTWRTKKSLHPNTITALMRIVAGTQSSNPSGWGYRTIGWKSKGDGKVPADFRNEERIVASQRMQFIVEANKGKMSDAIIKTSALMVKRWIIQKGKEGNVSAQLNGLASLILFDIACSDRGQSIMSKALAMSGLFREGRNE